MGHLIPTDQNDLRKADASPTKEFFVDIITKDIQLDKAIYDLVDNCVDGAKRLRPQNSTGRSNYEGLEIRIELYSEYFKIKDNCGGIPLEVARKYAFKFGRSKGYKPTRHSIGQFGVGMKRALFKMGEWFKVDTVEPESKYAIVVDVPEWCGHDEDWDFTVSELVQEPNKIEDTGTIIEVRRLEPNVSTLFEQNYFIDKLRKEIRDVHQIPMNFGLKIFVNDTNIIPSEWQLKDNSNITTAYQEFEDWPTETSSLKTRIYAGVGDSVTAFAGWYVFCNGRCVLRADKTDITVWGEESENETTIPKYHNQFSTFRGYAFLDSDDASVLPWNTKKDGLSLEADAYETLKWRLVDITRPVIDFLNELDKEKDYDISDRKLVEVVRTAQPVKLEDIGNTATRQVFTYSKPPAKGPPQANINYRKSKAEVEALMHAMKCSSYREAGEKSFDYAISVFVRKT